jgi:hypothetical protein
LKSALLTLVTYAARPVDATVLHAAMSHSRKAGVEADGAAQ